MGRWYRLHCPDCDEYLKFHDRITSLRHEPCGGSLYLGRTWIGSRSNTGPYVPVTVRYFDWAGRFRCAIRYTNANWSEGHGWELDDTARFP